MNKYQEVMEHLSVSQLSRQRILKNVREEVRRRRRVKLLRLLPAAAAALLVVALLPFGMFLTQPMGSAQPESVAGVLADAAPEAAEAEAPGELDKAADAEDREEAAGTADLEEAAPYAAEAESLSGLAERTGLALRELTELPFVPESVTYTAYADDVAEILYAGEGQELLWRISEGSEDNSGDFTDYPRTEAVTAAGQSLTLRGEGERVTIVWWSDGAQSYSIAADPALGREEMLALARRALE